jgi:DNA invertase Pin-like site-specific DNA recombinase
MKRMVAYYAALAERRLISERTGSALAAKKAQGAALGNRKNIHQAGQIGRSVQEADADRFAMNVIPIIESIRSVSLGVELLRSARLHATCCG